MGAQAVSDTTESTLQAEFYIRPVAMSFLSEQQQRPVFEDRTFVRMWVPGDRTTVIDREAFDEDKRRFPVQWAAYQNNSEQMGSGCPIGVWHEITPSQKAELNAMGFKTVESIAQASDAQCQGLGPGGVALRIKAQRFLGTDDQRRGPGRPPKEREAA